MRDDGAWEAWLAFFLQGVLEVSEQAARTAHAILVLRERHRGAITDGLGRAAANGHRVLEHLYRKPIVSVREVKDTIGTTYAAANSLVARLVEHGILEEPTGQAAEPRLRVRGLRAPVRGRRLRRTGRSYAALSIANDTCRPSMVAWMLALPLAGSRTRASVSPAM